MEDELSQAVIIIGLRTIFFRFLIKGDKSKKAMKKKDKKRNIIKIPIRPGWSPLFSLFLKYNKNATSAAAIIAESRNINQYFVPNEIKLFTINVGVNIHISFFLMAINV